MKNIFLLSTLVLILAGILSACGGQASPGSLDVINPADIANVKKGGSGNVGQGSYIWVKSVWKTELKINTLSQLVIHDSFLNPIHSDLVANELHVYVIANDEQGNPMFEVEMIPLLDLDIQGEPSWNIHFKITRDGQEVCKTGERSISLSTGLGVDPALYCR